jgi:hypothetical protein
MLVKTEKYDFKLLDILFFVIGLNNLRLQYLHLIFLM